MLTTIKYVLCYFVDFYEIISSATAITESLKSSINPTELLDSELEYLSINFCIFQKQSKPHVDALFRNKQTSFETRCLSE